MCVRTLWLGLESTGRWGSYPSLRGVISERCCGRMKLRRCPTKRKTPRPRGCKGTLRHSAGVVARLCAVVESTRRAASYLPRDAYTLPVAESSSITGRPARRGRPRRACAQGSMPPRQCRSRQLGRARQAAPLGRCRTACKQLPRHREFCSEPQPKCTSFFIRTRVRCRLAGT